MEIMTRDAIAVLGACGVLLYEMVVFHTGPWLTGIMVLAMLVGMIHWLAAYGPAFA